MGRKAVWWWEGGGAVVLGRPLRDLRLGPALGDAGARAQRQRCPLIVVP